MASLSAALGWEGDALFGVSRRLRLLLLEAVEGVGDGADMGPFCLLGLVEGEEVRLLVWDARRKDMI